MPRIPLAVTLAIVLVAGCTEDNDSVQQPGADAAPSDQLDGSVSPDGGPDADGGPTPDGAPLADAGPDPCVAVCARFVDCAGEVCPDADADAFAAACATGCAANPSFAPVAAGTETCADWVAFAGQTIGDAISEACVADPGRPTHYAECSVFAERIVACLGEECPRARSIDDRLVGAYTHFCDEAAGNGALDPVQVGMLVNANTPCEAEVLAGIVREQLEGGEDGGGMAAYCADEAGNAPETCDAACEVVAGCIPPEAENAYLRNADRCFQLCAVFPDPGGAWACTAASDACDALGPCFEANANPGVEPPPGACETYGARAAECVLEAPTCDAPAEALGAVEAGLVGLCRALVRAGEVPVDAITSVSAESPCDHEAVAPIVGFLITDTPANADDGGLVPLCTGATERSAAICTAACENLAPCIPENSDGAELRDPGFCTLFCLGEAPEVPDAAWACFGESEMGCQQVLACLQ